MEATTALSDGIASIFSLCGLCTEKQRFKIVVLVVSFILETVDMVTDWMNWNQWRSVDLSVSFCVHLPNNISMCCCHGDISVDN